MFAVLSVISFNKYKVLSLVLIILVFHSTAKADAQQGYSPIDELSEAIIVDSEDNNDILEDIENINFLEERALLRHVLPRAYYKNWLANDYWNQGNFNTSWMSLRVFEITLQFGMYDALASKDLLGYRVGDSITGSTSVG